MVTPPPEARESGAFRDAMRLWATGVAVVTTQSEQGPHGMTVNSLLSVSLDPPTVLISLKRGSRTEGAIQRTGRFTVNVLASGQQALAGRFARRRVPGAGEFAGVRHRPSPDGGGPELEGSAAVLACRTTRNVEVADHTLIVAEVTGVRRLPADDPRGPLLYVDRGFRDLAGRPPGEGAATAGSPR
ncbi:flavin reductase family protein [Streptomyces sp. CAU 1734]|uniref:flavin reductase family protein n=1 Tax=Streptomyces sp. CAU 1734 TaxID=3140360 RepID=UPI003260F0FD